MIEAIDHVFDDRIERHYVSLVLNQVYKFDSHEIISSSSIHLSKYQQIGKESELMNKIIVKDFETFGIDNGLGQHTVFSCGYLFNQDDYQLDSII